MKREEEYKERINKINYEIELKNEEINEEVTPGAYFYDTKKVDELKEEIKKLNEEKDELNSIPTRESLQKDIENLKNEFSNIQEEMKDLSGSYFLTPEAEEVIEESKKVSTAIENREELLGIIDEIEKTENEIDDLEEELKEIYKESVYVEPDEQIELNEKKEKVSELYEKLISKSKEYGVKVVDIENQEQTSQAESQTVGATQTPENENPTQTPVEPMTQAQQIPQQETQQTEPQTVGATQTPENENPTQTPVEPMTQAQQIPQQETQQTEPQTVGATQTPENKNPTQSPVEPVAQEEQIPEEKQQVDDKLNVEVFAKGVRVNGEKVSVEDINKLCNGKHWHIIKEMLIGELGEEKVDQVIDHGDPNIIAAILISGEMNEKVAAGSVNKYHEAIFNPKAKENKMAIKYNLKNMSFISRLLGKCHFDEEEVKAIKDRAYEAKDYAEIEAGPLTRLGFKIRDMIDRASQKRLANKQNKEQVDEKTPKQEVPGELTPEQKAQVQQKTAEIARQHTQQPAQQQENNEPEK